MIRKLNPRKMRRLRWTGLLLIVLALFGCARGDWINETLTLVDVTGTWEGAFQFQGMTRGLERNTRWVLQQKGGKVRGEAQGPDGAPLASIEGLVNGEVFSWQLTGPFVLLPGGSASSRSYRGETTVNSDEMSGRADGQFCPCTVLLRRLGSEASGKKVQ
jgi:hypothetical protein